MNTINVAISAGYGVEAQDWADMLRQMIVRWAAFNDLEIEMASNGELSVSGSDSINQIESMRGIHRLVRISPHDPQRRRHTAFAKVDVWKTGQQPELSEEQVRSYVLNPYWSVTDHRTGKTTEDILSVLAGHIDLLS